MKKLSKVFFIPIKRKIEMRIRGKLTRHYSSIMGEYLHLSKLKFIIFGHDRMVVVVVEEHYM